MCKRQTYKLYSQKTFKLKKLILAPFCSFKHRNSPPKTKTKRPLQAASEKNATRLPIFLRSFDGSHFRCCSNCLGLLPIKSTHNLDTHSDRSVSQMLRQSPGHRAARSPPPDVLHRTQVREICLWSRVGCGIPASDSPETVCSAQRIANYF